MLSARYCVATTESVDRLQEFKGRRGHSRLRLSMKVLKRRQNLRWAF